MLKISLPSVQNIKKVLGLVKSAKKRGSKAKVRAATTKKLLKRKAQKSRASAKKAIMQQSSPFQPVGESEGLSA